jgi:hypothetical protein
MVEVAVAPGGAMVMGAPVSAKLGVGGGSPTVIATFAVSVTLPEVPVTCTV